MDGKGLQVAKGRERYLAIFWDTEKGTGENTANGKDKRKDPREKRKGDMALKGVEIYRRDGDAQEGERRKRGCIFKGKRMWRKGKKCSKNGRGIRIGKML